MKEKNVIYGEPLERTIFQSVGQIIFMTLRAHEDKILQVDAETGKEMAATEFFSKAIELAKWFRRNKIKPNDIISINSENCLNYGIICCAALFEGVACAPLNPEYTKGELLHVINLSKPGIVFCSSYVLQKVLDLLPTHSFIKQIIVIDDVNIKHPLVIKFADVVLKEPVDHNYIPAEFNVDETVATILCSSGTTGLPKGVMTTHSNITCFFDIAKQTLVSKTNTLLDGTTVALIPFFHSFGYMQLISNIIFGRTAIVFKKFVPKHFLDSVVKYQVEVLLVPSPIAIFLTKHPLVKNYDLSCIKMMKCGAAPLGADQEIEISKKFNINITQGYGMTETTLAVTTVRPDSKRPGSVGQVLPGMMVKVIDEEGNALGPRQSGEVCIKGPLIMKGYVGDDKATKQVIDKDKWLHSGDVAYYDEDGYFYIVDRIKELIKYKAFQVAPAELEALLLTHPAVADAAVIGLPDERAGELPLAYVVRKADANVTEQEIQEFVANNVSSPKQLRGGVQFVNEIPKNPSGKILRRVLRERVRLLKSKL